MADDAHVVQELMAAISSGDLDSVRGLLDPELVSHGALGDVHGPTGFIEVMIANVRTAFPDVSVKAVGVVQQGDLISWRIEGSGTQTGSFLGLPPSGERIRINGIHQARVRDGKLVEHWQGPDILAMLVDLGRVPFAQ
jgi:predicted ester cyclase